MCQIPNHNTRPWWNATPNDDGDDDDGGTNGNASGGLSMRPMGDNRGDATAPLMSEGGRNNSCYTVTSESELQALLREASGVFALVAAFYGMVVTNWGVGSDIGGDSSMWLLIASAQWTVQLLYGWSLLAPNFSAASND